MNNRINSVIIKCIYEKIVSETADGKVERKELIAKLGYVFHIPTYYRYQVIEEFKKLGIIINSDALNYYINQEISFPS